MLLESCYLPDAQSPLIVRSWHDFFAKLGVEGFLSIKEREEHLNKANIVSHVIKNEPFHKKTNNWFPTRSDINQAVQSQKQARSLKF